MARIVLFTRGDPAFGSGHLYRTSWLRETLLAQPAGKAGRSLELYCTDSPLAQQFWAERDIPAVLAEDPVEAFLAQQEVLHSRPFSGLVCVMDWLDSAPEQVHALRAAGARVALLDDYGPAQLEADLVLNSLLAPLTATEEQLGHARVLSGAPFLQLPPAVTRLRGISIALTKQLTASFSPPAHKPELGEAPPLGPVHSVVLSFGGTPRAAQTRLALSALSAAGYTGSVSVMPAPAELVSDAPDPRYPAMTVRYAAAADGFHDLLAGADLALLAGGLSLYEAAFLGIPVVVLPIVPHQVQTARKLAKAGCCVVAEGWRAGPDADSAPPVAVVDSLSRQLTALLSDALARGRMSAAGQKLCDGRGLLRTAELVLELGE